MKPFLLVLISFAGVAIVPAQNRTPPPEPVPSSAPAAQQISGEQPTPPYPPPKNWPSPVEDERRYTFVLGDLLEFRPARTETDFRWDVEGWHGGDFNRLWFKSEGERHTALKADYDIDYQLLYGRFVKRFYDFQTGLRVETQGSRGAMVARPQYVIGLEGLVPFQYEVESALFIDFRGNVSGRLSVAKDFLITQRWILQGRAETNIAAQSVERFTTGRGLNNIEAGLRLRYGRKFGPYFGISYDQSFFGTANFVRQEGGHTSQVRFVAGVRLWR